MTPRPRTRVLIVTLTSALAAIAAVVLPGLLRTSDAGQALHLRQAGELTLPGGSTRFDYESLAPARDCGSSRAVVPGRRGDRPARRRALPVA